MRSDVVGQHQGVAALAVGEVEVGAFHLHEARDKVEVGLAVLHYVVPGAVAAGEFVLDAEAVRAQHFLDDVGDFFKLEDLEVGAACCVPQPGPQDGFVAVEVAVTSDVGELGDLAGDESLATSAYFGCEVDLDAQVFAQKGFGRDGGALADHAHAVFKQPGDLFTSLQGAKLQLIAHWTVRDEGAGHAGDLLLIRW